MENSNEKIPVVSAELQTQKETKEEPRKSTERSIFKIESDLLIYKLFYFGFGGAIGCVFPFLSVYYKQLGFSPNQIGIISGVRPLIGFMSGPVWGSIADRCRIRKIMMLISTFGWLTFLMGIGFVPPAATTDKNCQIELVFINSTLGLHNTSSGKDALSSVYKKLSKSEQNKLLEDRGWMFVDSQLIRVFGMVIALVILGEIVQSPLSALSDSGCIEHIGMENVDKYGLQRCWASFGFGLLSLVVGAVINKTRDPVEVCGISVTFSNYHVAFYFFGGCMIIVIISAFMFSFPHEKAAKADNKPKPNIKHTFKLFLTPHYCSWLVCMFVMGMCNGVIWAFLYWHMENLGASQLLIGLSSVVNNIAEILTFFVIFPLIRKVGVMPFMILGILGYIARFCVFAFINNPWFILPVEVLQGFTFAGVWCVLTVYFCNAVPMEMLGTLQGIIHGVYWGLGSGTGSMIGGILVEALGAKNTFWVFAGVSGFNLITFSIVQILAKKPEASKYEELID
ncbi:unnamed protein product [Mytilus coruscus]|uniref:Major facilitator superfamily (MFS) profile domain-containing protein n=1 Tax=Mytilus coruscus TaxID=42192 RepID=A0A6J8BRS4_MYTCO|nr:unnamed protein product [Mytilus coruscus]